MSRGKVFSGKSPTATDKPIDSNQKTYGWKTILFNCDCHTFHEVAIQLTKAISCGYEKGLQYANVVHHTGSATVYSGPKERCEAVATILEDIKLRTQVSQ